MSGLPAEARLAAGQLEDALAVWEKRTPGQWHRDTRAAGEEATRLCGVIIEAFQVTRDEITAQVGAYDDERRKGA